MSRGNYQTAILAYSLDSLFDFFSNIIWSAEWHGMLDEVILFNSLLDEDDVSALMNNGMAAVLGVEPVSKLLSTWGKMKGE